jgi:hypothetical protein
MALLTLARAQSYDLNLSLRCARNQTSQKSGRDLPESTELEL